MPQVMHLDQPRIMVPADVPEGTWEVACFDRPPVFVVKISPLSSQVGQAHDDRLPEPRGEARACPGRPRLALLQGASRGPGLFQRMAVSQQCREFVNAVPVELSVPGEAEAPPGTDAVMSIRWWAHQL